MEGDIRDMTQTPKTLAQVEEQRPAPIQDEATALIAQAIQKGTDVDTMEKLLAMRRELKGERSKEEYDRAMAEFQKNCPTIEKKVKGYNYKYADLTAIIEQVKGLLSDNGFSYTFDTDELENKILVYCKVKHIGGHSEVSKAIITKESTTKMNASQQSGAAMTYGKRYAFVNAFGILTGDEDTDAATTYSPAPLVKVNISQPIKMITDTQKGEMISLLGKLKKTSADLNVVVKAKFKLIDDYKNLTEQQADQLLEYMRDRVKKLPVGGFQSADDIKGIDQISEEELDSIDEGIQQQKLE